MQPFSKRARLLLLGAIVVLLAALLYHFAPITQNRNFYQYVDTRTWLGIPNFANVISNLPFLFVGILGLARTWPAHAGINPRHLASGNRLLYSTFYLGLIAAFFGSGYYHLTPGPLTLMVDRLAICISFMAFYCIVLAEYISSKLGRRLLLPLLIYSFGAVYYWYASDLAAGRGDLSAYILVQLVPIVHLPLILWLFRPTPLTRAPVTRFYYLGALLAYLLAKWAESNDGMLFQLTGEALSGHSLKHLLAGIGGYLVYKSMSDGQKKQG
ncbi:ceramidase domain-containing protein [Photobacterium atrarenae]|uniref:Ceramidase n=1 Tax=Photobacterium atrarenae TaxID=865757 RepID=A0ABY5GKB6_9GAMM|nr:ceramidase domain-containing protein [Photobacterium atrarenae]UTV29767.1 ceramidase [Photobacterium atrarenae]